MTKKLLKKSLLLFLSGIIIVSCTLEKDALEEHEHKELIKQRISLYEIPGLQSKINARIQTNKSMNRGGEIDYLELLNPDNVLLIEEENGNKHYTFSLNMQENNTLTNVVVKQVGTEIDYKVIEYASPDIEQWLIDNIDNGYSNIEPTITEKGGNPNSSAFCPRFHYSCPGIGHSLSDIAGGANCPYEFSDFIVTITYEACGGAGGGTGNFDHFGDDNSNNNTGSPSDNNYGSGGNNNNTTFTNPNPPCDPRVDCPLFDQDPNPCNKLKNLFNQLKPNIKPKLIELANTIVPGDEGENLVSFQRNSGNNYGNISIPASDDNSIVGPTGGNVYGEAHTHPLGITYPMFSWTDVHRLLEIKQAALPHNENYIVNVGVFKDNNSNTQVYALVFNEDTFGANTIEDLLNQPELNGCTTKEKLKMYDEELREKFEDDSSSNYERAFLRQFYGFNVSLYKANSTLTNWSRLQVNTLTGIVVDTPCN